MPEISCTITFCILWTPRLTKWLNKIFTFVIQNIYSDSQMLISSEWQTYRVVFCVPVSFAQLGFGSFVNANAFKLHQISWMDSVDCNFQLILLQDSRTLAWPLLNTNFLLFKLFLQFYCVHTHLWQTESGFPGGSACIWLYLCCTRWLQFCTFVW